MGLTILPVLQFQLGDTYVLKIFLASLGPSEFKPLNYPLATPPFGTRPGRERSLTGWKVGLFSPAVNGLMKATEREIDPAEMDDKHGADLHPAI